MGVVYKQRMESAAKGYITFPDGEVPPPSALAGRRVIGQVVEREKERGRIGKALLNRLFLRLHGDDELDAGHSP